MDGKAPYKSYVFNHGVVVIEVVCERLIDSKGHNMMILVN